MFQSALVRRHGSGTDLVDVGTLAETLLFYGKIHMVLDRGILKELVGKIGQNNLRALIERRHLSLTYTRTLPSIFKKRENNIDTFTPTTIKIVAHPNGKKLRNFDEVFESVSSIGGASRQTKQFATFLMDNMSFKEIGPTDAESSKESIESDLLDRDYLHTTIRSLLSSLVPTWRPPAQFAFYAVRADKPSFFLITDLDFTAINNEYHKFVSPDHSSITAEYLLAHVLDARVDLDLSVDYMSELITKSGTSDLIRTRMSSLIKRRDMSEKEIFKFQEVHLGNARAIREVIVSGERDFSDFIPVLEKAEKFKIWLMQGSPDANLLTEYYKSATAETWIEGLPAKLVRYVVTSVSGLAGLVPGLIVGAADGLLIDRLIKGWRPNQFIEGPLKKFVSTS